MGKKVPRNSLPVEPTPAMPTAGATGELIEKNVPSVQELQERMAADLAQARLAAIIESSDDAIVSKSLEGIITSWNRAAQELFGYTPDEAIGKSILLIVPPERHDEERAILARL